MDYEGIVEEHSGLDTIFTVTYSSGTTGNPKGIVHSNRHYITMARYHDSEVSGIPNMGNLSTYSNVPAYSNSYLLSGLSDNLMKNGLNMLDPIDDRRYFPIGLRINHGNMNFATCSSWNILALNYFCNPKYRKYKIDDALFNFAVGEGFGPGEEALCNRFLRTAHAGRRIKVSSDKAITLPVGLAMMSVAGGECEVGSIFIRIHRSLFNKSIMRKERKDPIGMSIYDFVDVKILREDGSYADPYEIGRVTVLSDCNMQYYNHDPEATAQFFITDNRGVVRADMKDYGYIDERGFITIKGGNRVGITGSTVIEDEKIINIEYISSMNFRISREVYGCSHEILKYILDIEHNTIFNTLIVSPPGGGKTTILKDIIRNISNGIPEYSFNPKTCGVVDERGEIAAMHRGVAQNDVGNLTDIIDNVPKYKGMSMLIRSMSPSVIFCDEIGSKEDVEAIRYAICSGVKGVFTAHANSLEDLKRNKDINILIKDNLIQKVIVLDEIQKGKIKEMLTNL